MSKYLFASDLDNTLLFSYKHAQETDFCVERLQGKKQGYMTVSTADRLRMINEMMLFVPITSRSVEQYRRIQFPAGCTPKYALTTNGAILLIDGKIDEAWYQAHLKQVDPWREELLRIYETLKRFDFLSSFRVVDEMYLFAACNGADEAVYLQNVYEGNTALHVAASGRKVYFFPPPVNKGSAVQELKAMLKPAVTICAGDSSIDNSMLELADVAIAPESLKVISEHVHRCPKNLRFPDFVTKTVIETAQIDGIDRQI